MKDNHIVESVLAYVLKQGHMLTPLNLTKVLSIRAEVKR